MGTIPNLNKLIHQLICYQVALISAFAALHPGLKDWQFLLDFPKTGEIEIGGQIWMFNKHGVGLLFRNVSTGEIIDVHKYVDNTEIFDSWRLEQFLDSIGVDYSEYDLADCLAKLKDQGVIKSSVISDGYFELSG
ncbi:hypothetical protein FT643_21485 [Ketobacter sp. MCCC 1A13808]|uniref:DUF6896 domain-containing protein n=1 Tax=Ketobacter sp. MCCC 1A13808 TaxID=2602738 RepID=UPI0012EC7B2E|nr:hypothetical protein [Ketobacter sp. MCCC 1A13808]MVF14714.1 hypothetical protein [Ketobacter sp. MCCC 1A13808]